MRTITEQPIIFMNDEISDFLSMQEAIEMMRACIYAEHHKTFSSPARININSTAGNLIFTAGGGNVNTELFSGVRLYYKETLSTEHLSQVTVLYTPEGKLLALYIGDKLGEWRGAAIAGVAFQKFISSSARTLGVIGCGPQAKARILAATVTHHFSQILIYCRTRDRRERFCVEINQQLSNKNASALDNCEALVKASDVLICATNSQAPVFDSAWLKETVHIHHVGSKIKEQNEIPLSAYEQAQIICTDSLNQAVVLGENFFLHGTPMITKLSNLPTATHTKQGVSIFISLGLAGTEVALLNAIVQKKFE